MGSGNWVRGLARDWDEAGRGGTRLVQGKGWEQAHQFVDVRTQLVVREALPGSWNQGFEPISLDHALPLLVS